jgi:hypothetical protein
MKTRLLLRMLLLGFSLPTLCASAWGTQQSNAETTRIERLVALCKLWGTVKYFHPYLAYRSDIDWDKALVTAIPKAQAAKTADEYAAAVQGMLDALGDPVTRVVAKNSRGEPSKGEKQPSYRFTPDNILIVTINNYADLLDFEKASERMARLRKELPKARGVLFDLRSASPVPEDERGYVSSLFDESEIIGALTSTMLKTPSERRRIHFGFAEQGISYFSYAWGNQSGFYTVDGRTINPPTDARDIRVVFLVNAHSEIPSAALALQAAGKAAIVAEGVVTDDSLVTTQQIDLIDGVVAQVRLGELVYPDGLGGVEPDLSLSGSQTGSEEGAAFQAALALVRNFKPARRISKRSPVLGVPVPDKPYSEMGYPPPEYRLLAAFRIWTVINYFFPYKDLMGEDWDAVLREFIPKMEQAGNALEYHLAAADMVSHIHDSHGFVYSLVLRERFRAVPPVRVRVIEGVPVITAFGTPSSATCGDPIYGYGCHEPAVVTEPPAAGLELGDVILKVDGEDVKDRMTRMSKYIAASTPQSLRRDVAYLVLAGPKDSKATLTLRDRYGHEKEVELPRNCGDSLELRLAGGRSGEVYKLLSENFGYADLTRLDGSMVDGMFDKFKDTKAIILDMRGYPSSEAAWAIAARLAEGERPINAIFHLPVVMFPDAPSFQRSITETMFQRLAPTEGKWKYKEKTVMLIDERAQSAAEYNGLIFEATNGTKFVGSPTAGANGSVTFFWARVGSGYVLRVWRRAMPMDASFSASDSCRISKLGRLSPESAAVETKCWTRPSNTCRRRLARRR